MRDFFGKKGKSWQFAVIHAEDNKYSVECIVHIFDTCIQNWFTVTCILEHVLEVIKTQMSQKPS